MKICIDLNDGGPGQGWLRRSRRLAWAIKPLLVANVLINRFYLHDNPNTPSIYRSGVRYRNEDPTKGYEDFAIIPSILKRGWGDCDDLCPWRVAELHQAGETGARIRIKWKRTSNGKLYHIQVRRADGRIEDPSRLLGMKG
jgi:hypothetical protein